VSACATAAAYLVARVCCSAVFLQDTGGGRPEADRRGTALPVFVLEGRVRAGAEQRGHYVGTSSAVQRRGPAGGGSTGPHRFGRAPTRRTKGPPGISVGGPCVQLCAGVDERIDSRQMAVFHRIVQRRPPTPVQCKGGGGVGVAQRVNPTPA
jgi:hypothetical protein